MDKKGNYSGRKTQGADQAAIAREYGTVPPQATDVEEAVLGAMLVEETAATIALGELTSDSFYHPRHRIIFEAMRELANGNTAIDMITVSNRLKSQGKLDEVGGVVTLGGLTNAAGAAAHLEFHIGILKQKAIQRGLIAASYEIQKMAFDDSVTVDDLMITSQSKVFDIIRKNMHGRTANVRDILNDVVDGIQKTQSGEAPKGVPTGYAELDRISMGWQPGNLIVIGARPGVGKTAIALNLASNAAIRGRVPVAFFSLEMTQQEITKRLIEAEAEIPGSKIKGEDKLEQWEWAQMEKGISSLYGCDFFIDDTPAITTTEFQAKAKNLVETKKVGIIFIDYLQLMKHPGAPNVREEVSEVSHRLKAMAKELNVPVIALAQLNRQVSQREGGMGKPILSDIKESGAIEQDADIVMFLHRPDPMGLSENPESKEYAEIIVAKNRNGSVRTIPMVYKDSIVKFKEPQNVLTFQSAMNEFDSSGEFDPFVR